MNSDRSQPSTVIITGATRGLGRAMVDEFVQLGHTVLGCARTPDQITQLKTTYPKHDFRTVDVTLDAEVKAWIELLVKQYGPPDFVLNNAAVLNSLAPLWEVADEEFSSVIDTNIKGVVNVIRHLVPPMISRKRGIMVNLVSRWGRDFEALMAPYCATKWAVVALTRVLAEELKSKNVSVVGLNPGTVDTGMLRKYLGGIEAADTSTYPTPAEWAKVAVPFVLRLSINDTGTVRNVYARSRPGIYRDEEGS
jgi:NAD(P)-dependent dehydrogenase (short-subunit alcohol dehydrogenase family)